MRTTSTSLALLLLLLPARVFAQASLTGTVRDTSGAVLPGVAVEAASPALIEKTRTAVTDGSGQYRIIDLRPGIYSMTFALPGFNTVKRDHIELSGTQTVTVPIEMRVGGVAETVTVTGISPVVDVQSAKREVVLDADVIQTIPAVRAVGALLNATPGLTVDTNGLAASPTMTFFSNRGGPAGEGRMAINGMVVAAANGGGGVSSYVYDSPNAEEIGITVGGGLGESDIGGPVMNLIPRAGGNTFKGIAFFNEAGDWSRGNNLNDDLRAIGLTDVPGIITAYDVSASYGGPIKKDRLWFFGSYRKLDTQTAVEGITANANAFNSARWDWVGSPTKARLVQGRTMYIGRLTAQIGKHRISFNSEYQQRCEGTPLNKNTGGACRNRGDDWIGLGTNTAPFQSPEATSTAARGYFNWPYYVNQAFWTAPITNKLLLEGGFTAFRYYPTFGYPPPDGITDLTPVTEQSNAINPITGQPYAPRANYTYRGLDNWGGAHGSPNSWRASASYVTGAHNLKIGYQGGHFTQFNITYTNESQLAYRVNQGVPNAVTYRLPDWAVTNTTTTDALFVQESWTRRKLTLQGALRYDRAASVAPADGSGTTRTSWTNSSPIAIARTPGVDAYHDITPRFGVAYDLLGNGRTALKFNWGHYLAAATNDSPYNANNPAATTRVVTVVTNRGWTDTNGNKRVDCDLTNPAVQTTAGGDICAGVTGNSINFGRSGASTIINPEVLKGWGTRTNDHQWAATLQQQLVGRVSLEVSYARRTFHGRLVTDDLNHAPSDYDKYTIIAPADQRLPGGGGYPIDVYVLNAATERTAAQNYLTFERDFGPERINYWHGVDVAVNARVRRGLTIQAGTSTGREVEDDCATVVKLDNAANINSTSGPNPRACHDVDPFTTTLRGLASYTIPKIDVLVSATMRSQTPSSITATWNVPNTCVDAGCLSVQNLLGRLPSSAVAAGNTTIALTDDEHRVYASTRRAQFDMRFAKIVRFRGTRSDVGIDLSNLLNTNYATGFDTNYRFSVDNAANGGSWANPTSIYAPRYVRINYTLNF